MSNITTIPFMCEIPEDKKKLLELKYTVYCDTTDENWAYMIVDNNNKKTIVKGQGDESTFKHTPDRLKLIAILEAVQNIFDKLEEELKAHVNIEVYTDSVYCTNVLREWMYKWVDTDFDNKPNADLLPDAYELMHEYKNNINFKWYPTTCIQSLKIIG